MKLAATLLSVALGLASAGAFAQGPDNWIISETTSPVDYTPMVNATTYARGGQDGPAMRFSIHCRAGRVELVVAGSAVTRRGEQYAITYRVNDGAPVQVPGTMAASGVGVAFGGDAMRLLRSLPDDGSLAVRVATRGGTYEEGQFSLGGLKVVRDKVAAACK
jgi:hypothetical protein